MDNSYHIIEIDNIHSLSFVIPYEYKDKDEVYLENLATSVLVLSSMSEQNIHLLIKIILKGIREKKRYGYKYQ